ncbi:MAG: fused MFS/spermidine synthase [Pirellulales bacterium]|nr:fused MFS/spermidine synthase [Pirellulales bacterium]
MLRYALTIFLSSFLLFQVQPLIGKFILPWFGGSPAVWTTCMLSFQVLLLVGYSYAHFIAGWLSPRRQGILHIVLLAASLIVLPIIPEETWKPTGNEWPTWRIMCLLSVCIGGPYLMLSSTGPLLQSWFSRTCPGRSPYRLYALSNLGSLIALVSYPFAFEPLLRLTDQAWSWSIAYMVFAVLCGVCAVSVVRLGSVAAAAPARESAGAGNDIESPSRSDQLLWLALAACGSVILLATTNQMCQEVAVVPFLWVLPLSLYLVTFIICFDSERWYRRSWFGGALLPILVALWYVRYAGAEVPFMLQIVFFSGAIFVCCMICHGELVKLKPHPRYLTKFYLMIAGGGALGGVFTTLIAPLLFTDYSEYNLGLAACCLLLLACVYRDPLRIRSHGKSVWSRFGSVTVIIALLIILVVQSFTCSSKVIAGSRNFYGTLRVTESADDYHKPFYLLRHGSILHGFQYLGEKWRHQPTSYYGHKSGVGLAMRLHPRRFSGGMENSPLYIGVIGLGVGTIAAYGEPGDKIRFYEINPDVIRMAHEHFSYCKDSEADVDIVLGDARISLERHLRDHGSEQFDVLVVDAFSSDSIPMHLLTRECMDLYRQHLKEDGILAIHISNRHIDLEPLVRGLADEFGYQSATIENDDDDAQGIDSSTWVLVTSNQDFLAEEEVEKHISDLPEDARPPVVWTDDFSNLFELLKWD